MKDRPNIDGLWKSTRRALFIVTFGIILYELLENFTAVRSALDNTGKVILKDHMRHCMVDAVAAGDADAIDDLCQAIDKFMK